MSVSLKRLLIVDDELNILKSLQRMLEHKYAVDVASSGAEALIKLSDPTKITDVILCDLSMPGMSGVQFYENMLVSYPALGNAIIFMSGGAYTPDTKAFLENQKGRCLSKPFDLAVLIETIERIVA